MIDENLAIEFKGRHDHISARMRDHATRKLQKLQRFNDRILRIEVVADHAHEHPEVEVIAHMRRGNPVVAKHRGETFSRAIDDLVEKMERQLKRLKEKRTDHKSVESGKGIAGAPEGESDEETYDEVVRRSLRG